MARFTRRKKNHARVPLFFFMAVAASEKIMDLTRTADRIGCACWQPSFKRSLSNYPVTIRGRRFGAIDTGA